MINNTALKVHNSNENFSIFDNKSDNECSSSIAKTKIKHVNISNVK